MNTHERGRRFEQAAAHHLEERGWEILARNWRAGRREVDLVVRRGAVLAFVEVKGRRGAAFGHPLEAITYRKRREIAFVARAWLRVHPGTHYETVRFDAVAVERGSDGRPLVSHVEDAWRLP